ncbi:MAG: HlyD family efflux transporter periplasmic adaptor subunit [Flavobacteriaceae bacterium]|nr:HlyD family efflux transporter periplasmic adaptor subunit [Flavobacteriaceae bacterium]
MPNNQDIQIRSEEVQEILTKVPNWMIRWGNTLLLFLIVMLFAITWFVKYPDLIATQVMVTTSNPPEKIYANASGKFELILVSDRDSVTTDQTLAVIENTASYSDVLQLKRIVDTINVNRLEFFFPMQSLPPLNLGDLNTSFAAFDNNYTDYQLNKKYQPFNNESFASNYSLARAKGRLENLKIQENHSLQQLKAKENNFNTRVKRLIEAGVISQKEYEQKESELLDTKKAHKSLLSSVSQAREQVTNAQKTIKGGTIENIQKETRLLKKTIQSFYQLKKALKDWERQYVFKASINGQVSFLSYWDKNQTVKNGEQIFTIIPSQNNSFIGKIIAPAANSGKIKKGQKVQIQLANYPSDEYGELNGKVASISLAPNQDGKYLIDVALPKKLITTYDKEIDFRQEMKGTANIITEDLRLIERFFYQLKNILK